MFITVYCNIFYNTIHNIALILQYSCKFIAFYGDVTALINFGTLPNRVDVF